MYYLLVLIKIYFQVSQFWHVYSNQKVKAPCDNIEQHLYMTRAYKDNNSNCMHKHTESDKSWQTVQYNVFLYLRFT